jgi:hypothetical protein
LLVPGKWNEGHTLCPQSGTNAPTRARAKRR